LLIAKIGGIADAEVLAAAILHDTFAGHCGAG
jgi:hypothetical protein